ncbi:MAG: transcriptional regulator protein [Pseudomonadaceae bacterium]|nr:transcriptional regulator protein [Pseudomonadaceae bacterium]
MNHFSPQDASVPVSSMGVKLVELETFLVVAESGSFSVAAQKLHVTQPSVTSRIQRLEAILGTKLLERTTRRVELTEQGKQLATEAGLALRGLLHLVDGFRKKASQERQRVVVAATPTIAALTLPKIIQAYTNRYPDVRIELLDLQYADALSAIDSGQANLAVLALEEHISRYQFEPLWNEEMLLVVPISHEITRLETVNLDVLAKYPLMIVEQYQALRTRIVSLLAENGLTLPPSKVVGNLNTLIGMLNAGMGITLLPRAMAQINGNSLHSLITINGLDLRREFGLVFPKKHELSTASNSFCHFLRNAIVSPEK